MDNNKYVSVEEHQGEIFKWNKAEKQSCLVESIKDNFRIFNIKKRKKWREAEYRVNRGIDTSPHSRNSPQTHQEVLYCISIL